MSAKQTSRSSLKTQYPVILRISLIINLVTIILLFVLIPKTVDKHQRIERVRKDIEVVVVPEVSQPEKVVERPKRPSMPIEVPPDGIIDTITIEDPTKLFGGGSIYFPPPPPPPDDEKPLIPYIIHDEEPAPVGGIKALAANVIYPEIARDAGVEGTVQVVAYIDKKGRVGESWVLQGVPNTGLDEAALDAVRKTRFYPAKQRDVSVGVYMVIPIKFQLEKK